MSFKNIKNHISPKFLNGSVWMPHCWLCAAYLFHRLNLPLSFPCFSLTCFKRTFTLTRLVQSHRWRQMIGLLVKMGNQFWSPWKTVLWLPPKTKSSKSSRAWWPQHHLPRTTDSLTVGYENSLFNAFYLTPNTENWI